MRHEYVRRVRSNQLADLTGPMLGADLPLAERDGGLPCQDLRLPLRSPVRGPPVRLTFLQHPKGGFCQIASGGADGNGVALAPAGALVELDDAFGSPVRVVALANDHVGRFPGGSGDRLDELQGGGGLDALEDPSLQLLVSGEMASLARVERMRYFTRVR